jgi:hypothetical protein
MGSCVRDAETSTEASTTTAGIVVFGQLVKR